LLIPAVGVLGLQGDVREHVRALQACGAEARTVRLPADLDSVDALVLPGGESTTMSRLLRVFGLAEPLRERLAGGMPTMSTCAGLILLASEVLDGRPDQETFAAFDIDVRRNAYGRQLESFEADLHVEPLGVAPFHAVFIRAPRIARVGEQAEVVARLDGEPVAVRQGPHVGLAFHPEMTDDDRLHRWFVERVAEHMETSAA
jgi:pyridoxal 5'-phosphate synthase pdxT subunit